VRYLLNGIYLLLMLIASPYLIYRRLATGRYREGLRQKLWGSIPRRESAAECLWLHAVSVGEVLQIEPVVREWQQRHPDWEIAISVTTQTGMQVARKTYPGCRLFYCPLDFTWSVQNVIRRLNPSCLVLVELELWPNLIFETHRAGKPIILINGRLSQKSFTGYLRIKSFIRQLVERISVVVAQTPEYAIRFLALGAKLDHVHFAGSIKFDRLQSNRQTPAIIHLRTHFGIDPKCPLFMAGSTGDPEESIILQAWQRLREKHPDLQLLIAPRHQERFEDVAALIEEQGCVANRRSQAATSELGGDATTGHKDQPVVFLLDTLGELSNCWGLADFAFVGGSLNRRGGQNMMEPAAYGSAILLGPNTWNFDDVVTGLESHRACLTVRTEDQIVASVADLLESPDTAADLGAAARQYVLSQQGATAKTITWMEATLGLSTDQQSELAA